MYNIRDIYDNIRRSQDYGIFAKDAYQLAFQFDLALGIVIAIVGIVFVCRTARVVQLLSTCIGIVMLVDATFKIQTSIDSKRFGISAGG